MIFDALKSTLDSTPPQFLRARRCLLRNVLGLVTLGIMLGASSLSAAPRFRAVGEKELDKELAQYKGIRSLDASFEQVKDLKAMQLKVKSSGSFSLHKEGDRAEVDWQVRKPAFLKLRITADTLEIFEKEGEPGKPLVGNQEAQGKILRPLYAWLSMNSALIGAQYSISGDGKGRFRLEPKEAGSPVKALVLQLDRKKLVREVTLEEISGDELRITFSGTKVARSP